MRSSSWRPSTMRRYSRRIWASGMGSTDGSALPSSSRIRRIGNSRSKRDGAKGSARGSPFAPFRFTVDRSWIFRMENPSAQPARFARAAISPFRNSSPAR